MHQNKMILWIIVEHSELKPFLESDKIIDKIIQNSSKSSFKWIIR